MGADLAAEEQFGPYLVYERLGVGGMATVHRALERGIEGFERIVALKRLLPHLAEDASFIKAFVREAKLASILNHHNVVQIFELGRVGSQYFISMEYIDGRDVRRILRHARKVSGTPPIHITVGLLMQLAEALDYAHTKCDDDGHPLGLVHRDVSPSNLLVTSAGHLKVIDFGIAKAQSSQLRTQTGRVKGKLAYMAPEAVHGAKDLDARSDLWAAGVIAHELLTARPLFASKNEYQTLLKVQRGDIMPPSTFNQECPPDLDAIVLKLLARDPDERFADAGQMREALVEVRRTHKLSTGYRDIKQWLDWAFSLESHGGARGEDINTGPSGSGAFDLAAAARSLAGMSAAHLTPTPRPRKEDEDAVEVAWGGGEESSASRPIELDDVPDVSDKHLGAAPRIDAADDLGDDIPAPEPSHGISRPKRDTAPQGSRSLAALALPLPAPALESDPWPNERSSTVKNPALQLADESHEREEERRVTTPLPIRFKTPTEPPPKPASRFKPPTAPPPEVEPEDSLISTAEAPQRESLDDVLDEDPLIRTQPRPRKVRPSSPAIGEAVARESRSHLGIWLIASMLLVAGGLAVYLFVVRGGESGVAAVADTPAKIEPVRTHGTVKFEIDPPDVDITVAGKTHKGSPWSIDLPPGVHQIELRREGYKSRVTSLEVSTETQLMLISLEKLPRKVGPQPVQTANLILASTPANLEVVFDGQPLVERTPINRTITPGKHTVALRQHGVEVWRTTLVAEAEADHEFRPIIRRAVGGGTRPANKPDDAQEPPATPTPVDPEPTPVAPTAPVTDPPAPTPAPPPPPPPPPGPGSNTLKPRIVGPAVTGPLTVAPTAVKRIAGGTPTLGTSRPDQLPPVVSAKVCIDVAGSVTAVEIITKLERHTLSDLMTQMQAWRYAPYHQNGAAIPVCFSVNFRVK